ncbi:MAG: VCBS repeat-containing protein [Deltaproteobacteria bacterium]|nr:VCBS repeat-containing protein [Deltaproteobacteria bacterium]
MKRNQTLLLSVLATACHLPAVTTPRSPGLPNFDRVLFLESTAETSANVSLGDLNGDGHLDIVLAKGRHWPLVNRVFLGDGEGEFSSGQNLDEIADRSYSGSLVDLDRDGDLDVVISNDAPDLKQVYLNDGDGQFHPGSTYGHGEWKTRNADVADVDGDGRPDIIVANRTGRQPGASYICLNRGQGEFDGDCVAFTHQTATTITPADFDSDGLVDLAVPYRDGGQSFVYLNAPGADLAKLERVPFGPPDAAIRMAKAADLDGDGLLDLVTVERHRGVTAYFNQGHRDFSPGQEIAGPAVVPYALSVGDLNLDGAMDLIVGHVEALSVLYLNDGSGQGFTPVPFGNAQGTVYGFAVGDLDQDGLPDIAVAKSGGRNAVYFGSVR